MLVRERTTEHAKDALELPSVLNVFPAVQYELAEELECRHAVAVAHLGEEGGLVINALQYRERRARLSLLGSLCFALLCFAL